MSDEPKNPSDDSTKTELSKQDLDKVAGGATKTGDEETIRNADNVQR